MPYLPERDREHLEDGHSATTAGELNYQFTRLAIQYVELHGLSYKVLNEIVGALESAKGEFQRRVVQPYEDAKVEENGDVYKPLLNVMNLGRPHLNAGSR